MRLRIDGWRCENMRGGLRSLNIDLGSKLTRWTLVQMPNGTGKTTTMSLFRYVLSGQLPTGEEIHELQGVGDPDQGIFELRLSLDNSPYRIQLKLNFLAGTCAFYTARSALESGGLAPGWHLPEELRRLLTPEFTRLFVFDGELAKEIRDTSKEEAARAIRTLYKLNEVNALEEAIDGLIKQKVDSSVAKSKETRGLQRHRNLVLAVQEKLDEIKVLVANLQKKSKVITKQLAIVESKIGNRVDQDEGLRNRKHQLEAVKAALEKQLAQFSMEALQKYRSPAWIHDRILARLNRLGTKLQVLKLPKMSSAEFFKELAEQKECICGRPISSAEKKFIVEHADRYLAQDQIQVINAMKQAVRAAAAAPAEFTRVIEQLRSTEHQLRKASGDMNALEAERLASGDRELADLKTKQEGLTRELAAIEAELFPLTTKDPLEHERRSLGWEHNLHLCDIELKQRRRSLEEVTDTRRLALQGREVKSILGKITSEAMESLRERIKKTTNKKLEKLVPSEALLVARIGDALEISSGSRAKGGVSEGQSLAVAYAFLTSLLEDAPYKLPFIVDSPAVSLDTRVRREVGDLIPGLFDQMIMFVISSEREGFADAFYERSNTKFFTVSRGPKDVARVEEGITPFKAFHSKD